MHPALNNLRKLIYIIFDRIVISFGGYDKFNQVFKIAEFTGAIRNRIGYVGGASHSDYLNAIADSFPEYDASFHRSVLRDYWREHQRIFLELFMFPQMTSENLHRLVDFVGTAHLDRALSNGKGAILPVPHIGNVRLLHYALALKGYPVSVVSSQYQDDPEIVRRFKLSETSKAHEVGFRGQDPRWIIGALKRNRLVQIASTAEASSTGVEVKFMHRELYFSSGWIRLAIITGAPILPVYILRNDDHRQTIHIEAQFPLSEGKNRGEVILKTAQAFMEFLEPIYRANPHQIDWMSWHNRLREAKEHYKQSNDD